MLWYPVTEFRDCRLGDAIKTSRRIRRITIKMQWSIRYLSSARTGDRNYAKDLITLSCRSLQL